MGFYQSTKRWRTKRSAILRRDGYLDQLELRAGRRVEADTVHHILPIEDFPEYRWSDWNLISLSRASHEELHNRVTGGLSDAGRRLMRETAEKRGIRLSELILVIGLPEAGKSTYVKEHLGNGLAYDLDLIAKAFRMGIDDTHKGARKMANSMVKAFGQNARMYAPRVFIIRMSPTQAELDELNPDRVVVMESARRPRQKLERSIEEIQAEIEQVKLFCKANNIPCDCINSDGIPPSDGE